MPDRRVHAVLPDGTEVVRYDRAGKWYLEKQGTQYRKVLVQDAARKASVPGAGVTFDLPGGKQFDSIVRKRRAARAELDAKLDERQGYETEQERLARERGEL